MAENDQHDTAKPVTRDQDLGRTCEVRIRQQRYDRNGKAESVVVDTLKVGRDHGSDDAYAVVVAQIFTEKNRLEKEILTINSELILKAFRAAIKSYPTVASDFSEPFELESPFQMLYHYWTELDSYRESVEGDIARMHMNLLCDFMGTTMGPEREKVETQIKKGQIDFSRSWTIYRPGEIQIRFMHGHPWLLRCVKTAYEENIAEGKYLEVHCTHTEFDGFRIGQATLVIKIHQKQYFASDHPAAIKTLPIFPRRYFEEGPSLEQRMAERGAQFLALTQTCVQQYDGFAEHLNEPPLNYWNPSMDTFDPMWSAYKETGRVIIDRKTFQEDNDLTQLTLPNCEEDVDPSFCPPFVFGFSLAIKLWCRFYLEYVREVLWDKGRLDALVMKEEQKSLVHALVSSHHFPENPRDQLKQKGKGLVILLHGTPGSGKTLTAECCAEVTGRALLSTSLAELNKENRAWYFEHQLTRVLQYATIWKSVVLLDEADIFLEQRRDDVAGASQRNALVAVFLRYLEYFSGIVFLTTNRIDVFDEAMKSRIHLALGYNPPEIEMRRTLWTKFLEAATGDELEPEVEEAIDVFIRTELNGREISNVINTAQTLARFEGQSLHLKHIEQVLKVRGEFEMGLRKIIKEGKKSSTGPIVRRGSILALVGEC
ncbi:hypothetical protein DPSP01_014371 [Paraphaeosphaeria sporulosa]